MQVLYALGQVFGAGVQEEVVDRRAKSFDQNSVRDEIEIDHGLDVSKVISVETFELAHDDVDDGEHLDAKVGELSIEFGQLQPYRHLRKKGQATRDKLDVKP